VTFKDPLFAIQHDNEFGIIITQKIVTLKNIEQKVSCRVSKSPIEHRAIHLTNVMQVQSAEAADDAFN